MYKDDTPIWQLNVSELVDLLNNQFDKRDDDGQKQPQKQYLYGIAGIADLFQCSKSTANRIKSSGVIDKAIRQIGKKIIVDAELALELVSNKQERRRK